MSGQIVRQEYELTCIAPVHVGSGEVLRSFEYLYDRDKLEAYFLHGAKWFSFLEDRDLSDAFVQYLEKEATGRKSRNLLEWLKVNHVTLAELRQAGAIRRKIPVAKLSDQRARKPTLNNVTCNSYVLTMRIPIFRAVPLKAHCVQGFSTTLFAKIPDDLILIGRKFLLYGVQIKQLRGMISSCGWNRRFCIRSPMTVQRKRMRL